MTSKIEATDEMYNVLAETLKEKFQFTTTRDLDLAVKLILDRTAARQQKHSGMPLTAMVRGLRVMAGQPAVNDTTKEADVACVKALSTGSTPGSYLVPTYQADEIIEFLSIGGVGRSAGFRILTIQGLQKINIPVATQAPSWVWMAQNSQQTATDPNLAQLPFDLKERRSLVVIPNQLLRVSVPAFDTLIAELIGLGAAEHEDTALFSSTTVSGAPTALVQAAGITTINAQNNNANGGVLSYTDLLAGLKALVAAKAKGPFAWIMSPRTWYQRVLGLADSNSRPIVLQSNAQRQGMTDTIVGMLLGWPVYVSPAISESESVGSGSNQSHIIVMNPKYAIICQNDGLEMAVSLERYFDSAQTAIRSTQQEDWGFAPAAGICVIAGVN